MKAHYGFGIVLLAGVALGAVHSFAVAGESR